MSALGRHPSRFIVFPLLAPLLFAAGTARAQPGHPVQSAVWTTVKKTVDPIRLQAIGGENQKFSAMLGRLNAQERTAVMGTLSGLEGTYARDADSLELVGNAYNDLNEYAKAEEIGKRIQALNPESPAGYLLQSSALRSQGSFAKAGEFAKMAAERETGSWVGRSAAKLQGRRERPAQDLFAPRSHGRGRVPSAYHYTLKGGDGEAVEDALKKIVESAHGKKIVISVVGSQDDPPTVADVQANGVEIEKGYGQDPQITGIKENRKGKRFSIVLSPEFFKMDSEEQGAYLAGEFSNVQLIKDMNGSRSATLETYNRIINRVKVAVELGLKGLTDAFSPSGSQELAVEIKIWNGDYNRRGNSYGDKQDEYLDETQKTNAATGRNASRLDALFDFAVSFLSWNKQSPDLIEENSAKMNQKQSIRLRNGG